MTAYEAGFDAGERASFADRMQGVRHSRPFVVKGGEYTEGFWDGYCPRNASWTLRRRTYERAVVRSGETTKAEVA